MSGFRSPIVKDRAGQQAGPIVFTEPAYGGWFGRCVRCNQERVYKSYSIDRGYVSCKACKAKS